MSVAVLVPYRAGNESRDVVARGVLSWWSGEFPSWRLVTADSDSAVFARSEAINRAARAAMDVDSYVISDADIIPGGQEVAMAVAGGRWTSQRLHMLDSGEANSMFWAGDAPWRCAEWCREHWQGYAPLVIPRAEFWQVGGFDERFVGWGYEDEEFAERVRRQVGEWRHLSGEAFHLWHENCEAAYLGRKRANAEHYAAVKRGERGWWTAAAWGTLHA